MRDLPAARRFYEGTLGFIPTRTEGDGVVGCASGSAGLLLYRSRYGGGAGAASATLESRAPPLHLRGMTTPLAILRTLPLGPGPWPVADPFLFCVNHDDAYPRATADFAPDAPLDGRQIGNDFSGQDGWSLYHGHPVPGFPAHPHRGFETVTVTRRGLIDHSDSLGATARYGEGDVQWLTTGRGVVHAEAFPLLRQDAPNPLGLFQIWLNLPAASKMAAPHFTMFWAGDLPRLRAGGVDVTVVAGALPGAAPLAPPPESWAARPEADVAIWVLRLDPGARWQLPAAQSAATQRMLYVHGGEALDVGGTRVAAPQAAQLRGDAAVALHNPGSTPVDALLLQGRPIGEPVAQHGPFVMNTRAELLQAFDDYQRTQFGGWRFDAQAPVHGRDAARFARHPGGREERPALLNT